jgi:hypothetical protein
MKLVVLLRRDGNDDAGIVHLAGVVQPPQQVVPNLGFAAKCRWKLVFDQSPHVVLEI